MYDQALKAASAKISRADVEANAQVSAACKEAEDAERRHTAKARALAPDNDVPAIVAKTLAGARSDLAQARAHLPGMYTRVLFGEATVTEETALRARIAALELIIERCTCGQAGVDERIREARREIAPFAAEVAEAHAHLEEVRRAVREDLARRLIGG